MSYPTYLELVQAQRNAADTAKGYTEAAAEATKAAEGMQSILDDVEALHPDYAEKLAREEKAASERSAENEVDPGVFLA